MGSQSRAFMRTIVFLQSLNSRTTVNVIASSFLFCGVGAKHQNGVAEQNIKTVAQWARANMLHLAAHWPQYASSTFWPQAIDYAVWIFNRMPNMTTGISPNELWSSVRGDSGTQLLRAHVFGCPVYVLDTALKMARRSQNGILVHVLVSF